MPVAVYIVWTPCLHYVHNDRLLVSHLLPRSSFVVPRSPFLQGINAAFSLQMQCVSACDIIEEVNLNRKTTF
jgi:hypothetical protein